MKRTSTSAPFVTRKISKPPGFDQHFPAKCSPFLLLFNAELTSDSILWRWIFPILSFVTSMRFDNIVYTHSNTWQYVPTISIATLSWLGVRVPVGSRIITSPCRPDRLWGPPNLLYNGYRELFPGYKAAGA
jgi:hypothetical protein